MTEHSGHDDGDSRRSRWWVAVAVAFLLGSASGAGAVALLDPDATEDPTVTAPAATPTLASPLPTVDASAEAQVNAACLRVINEAQQVHGIISGVGTVSADVDLRRLDEMVRRLQPLEPLLQRDLQACKVDTKAGLGPASPTPSR